MSDLSINTLITPFAYSKKTIAINHEDGKVFSNVCDDNGCRETVLYNYSGAEAAQLAEQSARNMIEVIDNGQLYDKNLELDGQTIQVDPSWLPGNATVLVDFSSEALTDKEKQARLVTFLDNLWASGIMPSSTEIAIEEVGELEGHIKFRFRDPKLKAWLDLASLYLQLEDYKKAASYANKIIDFKLSVTTDRPVYYDEAVFLLTDINRIRAMEEWSSDHLEIAVTELAKHSKNLESVEPGYQSRYNYELLKTCVLTEQLFPTEIQPELCQSEAMDTYYDNTTFAHNLYTPTFTDNFLGARAYLTYAEHKLSNGQLAEADQQYDNLLALVDLIDDPSSVTQGDPSHKWSLYKAYMHENDIFIGEHVSQSAGLWSYALRAQISIAMRSNKQFQPDLFKAFRARGLHGKALIERKKAEMNPEQRVDHLIKAAEYLQEAYNIVVSIKEDNIWEFHTGGMYEERQTYYEVVEAQAESVYDLYTISQQPKLELLDLSEQLADEVIKHKADEPLDVTSLNAQLLKGSLQLERGNHAEARELLETLLNTLNHQEQQKSAKLPPHYQKIRSSVLAKLAILSGF